MSRKILVCGASGFLGRHVVRTIKAIGLTDVVCLQRTPFLEAPSFSADLSETHLSKQIASHVSDVTDVIHLATSPPKSGRLDESLFVADTCGQLANLLAALPLSVRHLTFASSVDVYGESLVNGVTEDASPRPLSYYGTAKLAHENMLRVWRRSGRDTLNVAILRLTHLYGPGDTTQKVLPTFMRAVASGNTPTLHGNAQSWRDFLHVYDAADGVALALVDRLDGTFNVSSGSSTTITQLAALCWNAFHSREEGGPLGDTQVGVSSARFCETAGFRPKIDLQRGLRELASAMIDRAAMPNNSATE